MRESTRGNGFGLHFGTGGLRALMGEGPDRLNVGTVEVATQGLAAWLLGWGDGPLVAVARDCRDNGEDFAAATMRVLAGNGIRVVDLGVAPTPLLSFAVRELGCSAGVVLTASHNAREYNGYKVYDERGCQATTRVCREVAAAIAEVGEVRVADDEGLAALARVADVRGRYLDALLASVPRGARGLRVAYSPLNGTGHELVPQALRRLGAEVCLVPEQAVLDGGFPTCPYPNPEDEDAMLLVERLALAEGCGLALATDPDADRVGVLAAHGGRMVRLSGDEVGVLLLDWLCREATERGEDVAGRIVCSTIVTDAMLDAVAARWGLELRRTLTGFKYVGEQMCRLEDEGWIGSFLVGIEESLGYLTGEHARDKDGVQGCALVAAMAAWHAARGRDLVDALDEARDTYGHYRKAQVSAPFETQDEMAALMADLRTSAPAEIAGLVVERVVDYAAGAPMPGDPSQQLPASNVLQWDLARGCRLIVRPSGTEPKAKAYCFARGETVAEADEMLDRLREAAKILLQG